MLIWQNVIRVGYHAIPAELLRRDLGSFSKMPSHCRAPCDMYLCAVQIFPRSHKLSEINDDYWDVRAEPVPEEELNPSATSRTIHVYHISPPGAAVSFCCNKSYHLDCMPFFNFTGQSAHIPALWLMKAASEAAAPMHEMRMTSTLCLRSRRILSGSHFYSR